MGIQTTYRVHIMYSTDLSAHEDYELERKLMLGGAAKKSDRMEHCPMFNYVDALFTDREIAKEYHLQATSIIKNEFGGKIL
mgnify:CR=1 FL=1